MKILDKNGNVVIKYEDGNDLISKLKLNKKPGLILSGVMLSGFDLRGVSLVGADLSGADLRNADLTGADLRNADLSNASLSGANLMDADLRKADLNGAKLRDVALSGADLREADLRNTNLNPGKAGADLRGAIFDDSVSKNKNKGKIQKEQMEKTQVKGDKRRPLSINELLNSSDKKDQVIGAYRLFVDVVPEKQRKSHQSRGSYLRDRKGQITNELVTAMENLKKTSSAQRTAKAKEFIDLVNSTVFAGGGGRKANLDALKDSFFK